MPIEVGIWRINDGLQKVQFSPIEDEKKLENTIHKNIGILDPDLMIIGNQIQTSYGKAIDLLAVNSNGDLVVIELKKNKTPREVVAQTLDYASWIETLTYEQISAFFAENNNGAKFDQAFYEKYAIDLPESLNETHHLIIVASELDNSTERIINYLSNYGVPINAVFFRYFKDNNGEYIARSWLIDPIEAELHANKASSGKRGKEIWNGKDWYISLGIGENRNWDDCQKYGFISAGGGKWYSNTLKLLPIGGRVFVYVPNQGYVGVGIVKKPAIIIRDFKVTVDGVEKPILETPLKTPKLGENAEDPDKSEYLVGIEWLKTKTLEQAIWEKGMFANQNSACKLRNNFTIERLVQRFGLEEGE